MKTNNLVGLWPNLSRAYEIALLGNLSLRVVFRDDYIQAPDDYVRIKKFYKHVAFSADGDITIEILQPDYSAIRRECETRTEITDRVVKAMKKPLPTNIKQDGSDELLKTAIRRLSFSLPTIEKVNHLAAVIAQLEWSDTICAWHVAEAIQYNIPLELGQVVAEDNSVTFGHGIKISKCELYSEDIEMAITYLKSRQIVLSL